MLLSRHEMAIAFQKSLQLWLSMEDLYKLRPIMERREGSEGSSLTTQYSIPS